MVNIQLKDGQVARVDGDTVEANPNSIELIVKKGSHMAGSFRRDKVENWWIEADSD